MTTTKDLETTISILSAKGKGILAADESGATITKRFEAHGIPSTEDTRRAYREMLTGTPGISDYIAGVILFDETLHQTTSTGVLFPEFLKKHGILAGIKVDKGLAIIPNTEEEQFTQGLDGLAERLTEYKKKGASFAKWRAVYRISATTPSKLAIHTNAEGLASYAALCQAAGIVPIVEPEILIDGDHTIEQSAEVTEKVLHAVFKALFRHKVKLEYIILKPSMVISGKKCAQQANAESVGRMTVEVLKRTVPAAVPTINFLSGGQSCEQATANLQAMNALGHLPWNVSYSYARALQDYPMKIWKGEVKNVAHAQEIFHTRAKLNSLASVGKYSAALEKKHRLLKIIFITGGNHDDYFLSTIDAKEQFTDLINRVAHGDERVILTRRGKEIAAIIPIEDLKILQQTQDKHDLHDAINALKEARSHGTIPLEQLQAEVE